MAWTARCVGLFVLAVAAQAVAGPRAILYVDASSPDGGVGSSWGTALNDLQDALAVADAATDIWVAAGIYRPDRGAGSRSDSFVILPGTRVFGGFAGGETSLELRNPTQHITVLSGEIGNPGDPSDNSFHVVRFASGSLIARLDGFTIEGGRASGNSWPNDSGGGVLIDGAAPVIAGCMVANNVATFGGGIFARNAAPTVLESLFVSNIAFNEGGGLVLRAGGLVRDCVFDGNSGVFGGGLLTCCGSARVERSVFRSNTASKGAGLYVPLGQLFVVGCGFVANSAAEGGGLFTAASGTVVVNSRFAANSAQNGGGVYTIASATLTNCIFTRNFGTASGGAVYSSQSPVLTNCTFWSNTSLTLGAALYSITGSPIVRNCILWGNNDNSGLTQGAQIRLASGTVSVSHSCVQGWDGSLGGLGNFGWSPLLANAAGPDGIPGTLDDDPRPSIDSPCIDAGDNAAVPPDATDLDGNGNTSEPTPVDVVFAQRFAFGTVDARIGVATVDIGAFELVPSPCAGDANADGLVNAADLSVLLTQFDQNVTPGTGADFNGDGAVDGADLSVLLGRFGTAC